MTKAGFRIRGEAQQATRRLSELVREVQLADQRGGYYHKSPGWMTEGSDELYGEAPSVALAEKGLDSQITLAKMEAHLEGFGTIQLGKNFAVVREPNVRDPHPRITGVVSNRFKPLQQSDVAKMLDPIGEQYPLEMLEGYGQWQDHIVWGFRFGEFEIEPPRDPKTHRRGPGAGNVCYLYISHVNDGGHGLRGHLRSYKISCTNQVPSMGANSSGDFNISIPHIGNVERKLVDWVNWLDRARAIQEAQRDAQQILADARIARTTQDSLKTAREVFGEVYRVPMPKLIQDYGTDITDHTDEDIVAAIEKYRMVTKRAAEAEQAAVVAYETYNDRYPAFANTWYTVVQAVAEVETWKKGKTRSHALLFGGRGDAINKVAKLAIARAR